MFIKFLIAITFLISYSNIFAQSDLYIFGYVQSAFTRYENDWVPDYDFEPENRINFMGINQLNLFFSKGYTKNISAFVNFEFTNNYSSNKGFGYFNLQEAYFRWDYKDYFRFKFGMLLPRFNTMYEIYNRFPLFPYIARPKMYETNLENVIDIFDILPQKALIQAFGTIPFYNDIGLEYAIYMGNPPNSYISSPKDDLLPGYVAYGQSATGFVNFGGRIGLSAENFSFGFSINKDKDNKEKYKILDNNLNTFTKNLGALDRTRFGCDFYFNFNNFTITAEYMKVITKLSSTQKDSLHVWESLNPYYNGNNFDKEGYFLTLQYNFENDFYLFAMIDYLNDKSNPYYFSMDGIRGINFGAGYIVTDELILKSQVIFNHGKFNIARTNDQIRKYYERQYQIGASFTF